MEETARIVERFNEAFNRHDVEGLVALMTDDCVFEGTTPPDGNRIEGRQAVRAFFAEFFRSTPDAHFETEEMIAAGARCAVRWVFRFGSGHVRGIDVFRVRDGKVAEKLSYVKG